MLPPLDRWCGALFRFVTVAIVMMCFALAYQDEIVNGLLPLFRAWFDLVDDTYRTLDLSVISSNGESMVRRLATPGSLQIVAGMMVYPDSTMQFSEQATTGMVLQPQILAIALLFGWPWRNLRDLTVRLVLAVAPLTLAMLLDVPTMLYGFAWFDELKAMNSNQSSFLVSWSDAMNAGGRFALAQIAVFVSVWIGEAISSRLARRGRKVAVNEVTIAPSALGPS